MTADAQKKVDVRLVPPPQRHPLILSTFASLAPGEAMLLLSDHDPKPLYYQFQATLTGQFEWTYSEQGPTVWQVEIRKSEAAPTPIEP
jgi:uncharacterized protein (DUF2249 family)